MYCSSSRLYPGNKGKNRSLIRRLQGSRKTQKLGQEIKWV